MNLFFSGFPKTRWIYFRFSPKDMGRICEGIWKCRIRILDGYANFRD